MPTTYDSHNPAIDRPYRPGEFARYAEAQLSPEAPSAVPIDATPNYSSHPGLQIEAAHAQASDLAMPADAHRGDTFVPPSQEVVNHGIDVTVAANAAALIGGMENMLSDVANHPETAASINAHLDHMNQDDALAPRPEALQYAEGGPLLEAYNAACAVMASRRAVAPESTLN